MDSLFRTLDQVTAHFDRIRLENVEHHYLNALLALRKRHLALNEELYGELIFEIAAFAVHESRYRSDDQKWFSDWHDDFSPALAIDYWFQRIDSCKNLTLRFRYAALVWAYANGREYRKYRHVAATTLIDAALEIANSRSISEPIDTIEHLRKATDVAIRLKDQSRLQSLCAAIVNYEDRVASDGMLGLWGFSYDILVKENAFPIDEKLEQKIVSDLEQRLIRLCDTGKLVTNDPFGAEQAARRLAFFYRRKNMPLDVKRVLATFGDFVCRKSHTVSSIIGASQLQRLHSIYLEFQLPENAEAVGALLKERAATSPLELASMSFKHEIPREEMDAFVSDVLQGDLNEKFGRVASQFIPRFAVIRAEIAKRETGFITSFIGNQIMDEEGRVTCTVGSVKDDFEGHVAMDTRQHLAVASLFLGRVMSILRSDLAISITDVLSYLFQSSAFDADDTVFIECGVNAYWSGRNLEAMHVLIPRIEKIVRRVISQIEGCNVLKERREGGYHYKTLDELLREPRLVELMSEEITTYLRLLLTDPRCWNLRNRVCHGLANANAFSQSHADRVFHVLLLLAQFRNDLESSAGSAGTETD